MIVYTDERGCIKDVGTTENPELIEVEIADGTFDGWSDAKICCYRIETDGEGNVTMLTPYVDSRLIDFIDRYGTLTVENQSDIADNREGIMETYEETESNSSDIADLREAVMELYEQLNPEEDEE